MGKPYIDDIICGSKGNNISDVIARHIRDVSATLRKFRRHGLTVKGAKCHLFALQVQFCGHILQNGTRRASPDKLAAIARWEAKHIKTISHMKGFLGLCQWYAIYMKDFAKVAAPLFEALQGKKKRGDKFIGWTPEMVECFDRIKIDMCENVFLDIADANKDFVLACDASTKGWGRL